MSASLLEDVMLAGVTLSVVLFGVGLVLFVAFLPLFIYKCFVSSWFWSTILMPIEISIFENNGHLYYWIDMIGILLILAFIQVIHLRCLWKSTLYLEVLRFLVLPIRKLVLPLVMFTARVESIREETPTLYVDVRQEQQSSTPVTLQTPLLSSTDDNDGNVETSEGSNATQRGQDIQHQKENKRRKKRLRRYKQMERAYRRDGIRHEWGWSESTLNLSQVIPVMWEHEQRMCAAANNDAGDTTNDGESSNETGNDKKGSVYEEFLKRFLVVTVVPDAILDYYYTKCPSSSSPSQNGDNNDELSQHREGQPSQEDEEILCCVQLSVQQGRTMHWFMYFALDFVTKSGIWFHGIDIAMERARRIPNVDYCNGQTHQTDSKRNAGFDVAQHTNHEILAKLYPWTFTVTPPKDCVDVQLWAPPHLEQQTPAETSSGDSQEGS